MEQSKIYGIGVKENTSEKSNEIMCFRYDC